MDIPAWIPDEYSEEFVRARLQSAGYYRAGESSLIIRLIGAAASSLERLSARVRRWAREPREGAAPGHRSALMRR